MRVYIEETPSLTDSRSTATEQSRVRLAIIALLAGLASTLAFAQNAQHPIAYRAADTDILYSVQKGETLSGIARKFTGSTSNWRAIGKLNRIPNDRTIPVGTQILIPLSMLGPKPVNAKVAASVGDVIIRRHDGQNVATKVGELLKEGDTLITSANSFISLSFDDDTRFTLQPESSATLRRLQATQHVDKPKIQLFLERGRVESHVTPAPKGSRSSYEVVSPIAVSSVRGTTFRVGVDKRRALNEIISGTVAVGNAKGRGPRLVNKGFGTVVEGGRVGAPVALLDPPSLADGYQLQEKLPVQFSLAHRKAVALHAAISKDPSGMDIVQAAQGTAENGSATVRFADLPDGVYFVHYSAIDAIGLRGPESTERFRVKARPFPPLLVQRGEKLQATRPDAGAAATMEWSQQDGVSGYRLQVANDASFSAPLFDQTFAQSTGRHVVTLLPGTYYWRVASVATTDGEPDQGPFSDPKRLEILAGQAPPKVEQADGETRFAWSAVAGQSFTFQLSDSDSFDKLLVNKDVNSPAASVPSLPPGVYYARVRSIDSDGFVGAFSPPQKFVIPVRWRSAFGDVWNVGSEPIGTSFEQ